jgi:hypothetical protein
MWRMTWQAPVHYACVSTSCCRRSVTRADQPWNAAESATRPMRATTLMSSARWILNVAARAAQPPNPDDNARRDLGTDG